ncbi:MAG: RNA polymerase sigma factor [Bacteroidetes bacterium]|nr:RNA polymerase sigma factor [Bacteroidota bacterium]
MLYDALSSKMFYVCLRYCRTRDDAEDVLQEGFIKVFKNLPGFKKEGSFEGWVRRIMVNCAIDHIRKQKEAKIFDDIERVAINHESDFVADNRLKEKELMALIKTLPLGYQTVFNLYVIEGYSHIEIAGMLNISEGTSKSQLSKAKEQLRYLLQKYFDVNTQQKRTNE